MNSSFSKRLREVRLNANQTQEQLAKVVGKSTVSYGAWERGDNEPPLKAIKEICQYLNVSADWLLGIGNATNEQQINIKAIKCEADQAAATLKRLLAQLDIITKPEGEINYESSV